MPRLRVFVSSTCYDLQVLRSELRPFIIGMGYEPVMSDYSDLLYDPRSHTHDSCLKEVPGCDVVLLIVGARFGGEAVPSALDQIDFTKLLHESSMLELLANKGGFSITQLEVLKAVEQGIPVYAFVDQSVYNDHHLYERNKQNTDIIDKIEFPSIQKRETAIYIFEFINFLRKRGRNNSLTEFSRLDDIKNHLTSQWSQLFQKLLYESKTRAKEERRYRDFSERIDELKAVVLASIATPDIRDTAKGAIKFRHVINFISAFKFENLRSVLLSKMSWEELLAAADIIEMKSIERTTRRHSPYPTLFIMKDRTFYTCRYQREIVDEIKNDWEMFTAVNENIRVAIVDVLLEDKDHSKYFFLRHNIQNVDEYMRSTVTSSDSVDDES